MGEIAEELIDSMVDYHMSLAERGLGPEDYDMDEHWDYTFGEFEPSDDTQEPRLVDVPTPTQGGLWLRRNPTSKIGGRIAIVRKAGNGKRKHFVVRHRLHEATNTHATTPVSDYPQSVWTGPFRNAACAQNYATRLRKSL